ncbi:MAG: bifunctional diguanylate cyclase/phosphodiesterase [Atopobiaceae bacterium]|nr:bifunctional diguanylate cyclase/phosphodiesterase [Atopobiaceae bacterium]
MSQDDDSLYKLNSADEYSELYNKELEQRNEVLLRSLAYFGVSVSGLGAIMRILLRGGDLFVPFCVLCLYFVVLGLGNKWLLRATNHNAIRAIYIAQAPAWALSILLGSVLDPTNRTVTLFLFVALLPLFILDSPRRVRIYNLSWCALFVIVAWLVKPYEIFVIDISFLAMFSLAALTTTTLVLNERLSSVRLFVESERHARTDNVTGLKNRYALSCDLPTYLNTDLVLGLARLDDLSFFVDLYGHNVGDNIVKTWAETSCDQFGSAHCYKYTASELLFLIPNAAPEEFEQRIRQSRKAFMRRVEEQHGIRPSGTVGYVYGRATDEEDLAQMINHADICLHEARHAGKSQVRGTEYDRTRLRTEQLADILGGNLQSDSIDSLTELPNMQAFYIRAHNLIDTVANEQDVVFIYFDLENFKTYNEEHGFQAGDDLLRGVAKTLRESFPRRLIARFGDDHFVVMCYSSEYEGCLAQAFNKTFDLHGRTDMPLKAGVYLYEDTTEDISVACDRAKTACNSVKSRYDKFWRLYDSDIRMAEERRNHIIAHIDDAIANNWLRVFYQPIVSTKTNEVVECEALVRWIDPQYGFLPPITFIGELEHARLIHKVDLWMVEHVCADYRRRVDAGLPALSISVNLSRLDFLLCDVEKEVLRITQTYGVPHKDLHLEVTESALSEDFGQLVYITNRLRGLGFEVWLDDFGSDYSSLTTLKDFPCDVIKLDLMFLRSFGQNERTPIIIEEVITLAKRLGARCLAEGVEEPEHLAFLANAGCDLAQGYLISKPEPLEVLVEKKLIAG